MLGTGKVAARIILWCASGDGAPAAAAPLLVAGGGRSWPGAADRRAGCRAIDYSNQLLADRYTFHVSVRVMEQAAQLDLTT